ncbi:glycosyltransferase family 87 protein [Dyadobacter frigoris]|uniref:DUF2029 domain-containing protein n=1 Tax=Dyadobacter frigoris TaxID=2576211 RepID=A0A4U6D5S9_9BACT|nr:glycosyltransferase family 87 protein [Dyadobacter frigoris]TKT89394.1 DUF2029 domain-containing protein [Dyadobacter frigoris]GLU55466.1 membrane protein [Dyadobacter frigoris]
MKSALNFFSKDRIILYVYLILSIVISLIFYNQGPRRFNNLIIYRQSFFHLLDHKNLYLEYPSEYYDIFLYHPAFTVFFSPLSLIPVSLSLILWTIISSLFIYYAVKMMPVAEKAKIFLYWFVLIELLNNLHSQQTNSVIAALGLLTFIFLEKSKPKRAALFPLLAFCIKGYGLVFAILFLFYPEKKKYITYSILWLIALTLLPLPFTGKDYFLQVYQNWITCLIDDHKVNFGSSVMGLMKLAMPSFTENDLSKVQLAGLILFAITMVYNWIKGTYKTKKQRLLLLAYTFLWVILFNHTSESPTYIIAITGVGLFFVANKSSQNVWWKPLTLFVLAFCILVNRDFFPSSWPIDETIPPLVVRVLPCLLVWIIVQIQLFIPSKIKNFAMEVEISRSSSF